MYGSSLPIGGNSNAYLAGYMRRYTQPQLVANLLAPIVPVGVRSGKYITLDRSNQRVPASTLRAPGARPVKISMGYSNDEYVCRPHAAETDLPLETQATAGLYGLQLKESAIQQVKDQIDLGREAEVIGLCNNGVSNVTTMTTGSTSQWSNAASDPIQQLEPLKLAIKYSGQTANRLILGPDVAAAARQNPAIIDRFKYGNGSAPGILTNDQLSLAFGIPIVEAGAVQVDGLNAPSFLWDGMVVLAFIQSVISQADVSALKTFVDTTQGVDGYEALEFPDEHPSTKKDWVSGEMAYDMKVTGQDTIAVLRNVA